MTPKSGGFSVAGAMLTTTQKTYTTDSDGFSSAKSYGA